MMINKTNYKDQEEQRELVEEEVDQQYEQERFTDEQSEYFEDDENKADRFTDDNAYRENFRLVNIYTYIKIIFYVDITIIRTKCNS